LDVITPPSFVQSGIIRYSIRIELFVLCVPFGIIEQLITHLGRMKLRYVGWNRDEYFRYRVVSAVGNAVMFIVAEFVINIVINIVMNIITKY
jgi:hypothetical protein